MRQKILIGLLKAVAALPLGALYLIADFIYFVVYYLVGYRKDVVRKNLFEAFPEKTPDQLRKIEKEYYYFLSETIVETVKLLHISDAEMKKRVEVTNPEVVEEYIGKGRNVVLLLSHYGNWEWVQEISKYFSDSTFKATIYHPLKSELWNKVYRRIRGRWNSHLLPQWTAAKALLNKDNQPWVCGFIADGRPRSRKEACTVEFLHHHTYAIYGPEVIGRKIGAEFFFLEMERVRRGYYRITFHRLEPEGEGEFTITKAFWRKFEKVVEKVPAYWLWSHKRWK